MILEYEFVCVYLPIVVSTYCVVLCFCFAFRRLVCHMLPVSLDCPFLIAPTMFSNSIIVLEGFKADSLVSSIAVFYLCSCTAVDFYLDYNSILSIF